jgi:hypothetical protein
VHPQRLTKHRVRTLQLGQQGMTGGAVPHLQTRARQR